MKLEPGAYRTRGGHTATITLVEDPFAMGRVHDSGEACVWDSEGTVLLPRWATGHMDWALREPVPEPSPDTSSLHWSPAYYQGALAGFRGDVEQFTETLQRVGLAPAESVSAGVFRLRQWELLLWDYQGALLALAELDRMSVAFDPLTEATSEAIVLARKYEVSQDA